MFWGRKKRDQARDLRRDRDELNAMAAELLRLAPFDFDEGSPLQQALLGAFFFGMLTAHGMAARMSPIEVHALALSTFQDSLHYTPTAAVQGVQACIDAAAPGVHDTMNAILHRGIDGQRSSSRAISTASPGTFVRCWISSAPLSQANAARSPATPPALRRPDKDCRR